MSKNTNTAKVETTETTATAPKKDLTIYGTPADLKAKHGSWSAVFRYLTGEGLSTGEVAKVTGKRYQHVRNVKVTPIKKAS